MYYICDTFFCSQRSRRSLITVTRNLFSSSSCIDPDMEPMAQHNVLRFFQDHSLPLTVGEFDEFGNAKDKKEDFDYIFSYAPYNNIKKMDYPNILITTSLSDNRVLFDEPAKFTAKLRDYKTDNNLLLLNYFQICFKHL